LNDIQNNKTHLKTIEVVSFQQNTLLAKKHINIHVQNCTSPNIFRDITSDPASTGRESGTRGDRMRRGRGRGDGKVWKEENGTGEREEGRGET
jgi:hypothetical protein